MLFTMREFLILFLFIWVALFLGCYLYYLVFSPRRNDLVTDPLECRTVISAGDFRKNHNQLTSYQSRAKHNERLCTVYGIENSVNTRCTSLVTSSALFSEVVESVNAKRTTRGCAGDGGLCFHIDLNDESSDDTADFDGERETVASSSSCTRFCSLLCAPLVPFAPTRTQSSSTI